MKTSWIFVRVEVDSDFACRTFVWNFLNICNVLVRMGVDSDFACRTDSQMCSLILQSQRFHHFPLGFDLGNLPDTFLINIVKLLVLCSFIYRYIFHYISYHLSKKRKCCCQYLNFRGPLGPNFWGVKKMYVIKSLEALFRF